MFITRKTKLFIGAALLLLSVLTASFMQPSPAYACKPNEKVEGGKCLGAGAGGCAEGQIYVTIAIDGDNHCVNNPNCTDASCLQTNPIFTILIIGVRFLSAGVGIAVVGGIVWGGIVYLTARENAGQVQKAIGIITNALIALLVYLLMFAIINFLIPGGILT